jgi:hypothetical protein
MSSNFLDVTTCTLLSVQSMLLFEFAVYVVRTDDWAASGFGAVDITGITVRKWPWWYRSNRKEGGIEEYEFSREFCVSEKEREWRGEVGVVRKYERMREARGQIPRTAYLSALLKVSALTSVTALNLSHTPRHSWCRHKLMFRTRAEITVS